MSKKRPLTENEIALSQTIFGDRVNYSKVHIVESFFLRMNAVTIGNTIHFPKNQSCADFALASRVMQHWFVHEMTHVWQYQNGFPVFFSGALFAICGAYYRQRVYCYDEHCHADGFSRMNMEQQANAVADYFIYHKMELCDTMQGFIHSSGCLKPKFW